MNSKTLQFQKGLSLVEFINQFSTEEQCEQYLEKVKLSQGFCCKKCSNDKYCKLRSRRRVYQCSRCQTQTSLTADTIFADTKLPLTKWFLSIFLVSQSKNGISALELTRQVGFSYPTAWLVKQKIIQSFMEKEEDTLLNGNIEIDDAYLGGKKKGKAGRGSTNKIPFIASVEKDQDDNPLRIKLQQVKCFDTTSIEKFIDNYVSSESNTVSDGLSGFCCIKKKVKKHSRIVKAGKSYIETDEYFKWVNIILGNFKTMMKSTYKHAHEKYVQRYLSEFEYRFNRRRDLRKITYDAIHDCVHTTAMPKKLLTMTVKCL